MGCRHSTEDGSSYQPSTKNGTSSTGQEVNIGTPSHHMGGVSNFNQPKTNMFIPKPNQPEPTKPGNYKFWICIKLNYIYYCFCAYCNPLVSVFQQIHQSWDEHYKHLEEEKYQIEFCDIGSTNFPIDRIFEWVGKRNKNSSLTLKW